MTSVSASSRLPAFWLVATGLLLSVGCGAPAPSEKGVTDEASAATAEGRQNAALDEHFRSAGAEFQVPGAVIKALAYTQSNYSMLTGDTEFEDFTPLFGVMGISEANLQTASAALGVDVPTLKTSVSQNIRAGAYLLAEFARLDGIDREQLKSWEGPYRRFSSNSSPESAVDFARHEVLGTLKKGVGQLSLELGSAQQSLEAEPGIGTIQQRLDVAPDFAEGFWYPSINTSRRNPGKLPLIIVIHTCESSYTSCRNYLAGRNERDVSSHYVVGTDETAQLVREETRAHHIGATYSSTNNNGQLASENGVQSNHISVGIEHGGFAAQTSFPAAQLERSSRLVCSIAKRWKIPMDRTHIVGHGQLQPANRTDPGRNWPWASHIARAQEVCAQQAEVEAPVVVPPVTGETCTMSAELKTKYDALGGATGSLGTCIGKEQTTADGAGKFMEFTGGVIYWHADTGAHSLSGTILSYWKTRGSETSALGYPTSEMTVENGVSTATFQNGTVTVDAAGALTDSTRPGEVVLPTDTAAPNTEVPGAAQTPAESGTPDPLAGVNNLGAVEGGCSATGGSSALLSLAVVGLFAGIRRRRSSMRA